MRCFDTYNGILYYLGRTLISSNESNMICIDAGYQYCKEQNYKQTIARLEPISNGNKGKIITEGNTAAALGAIYGGASAEHGGVAEGRVGG